MLGDVFYSIIQNGATMTEASCKMDYFPKEDPFAAFNHGDKEPFATLNLDIKTKNDEQTFAELLRVTEELIQRARNTTD